MWEGSALATHHQRVDKGWLPQHNPNTTQHPETAARDTKTSLHDEVTLAVYRWRVDESWLPPHNRNTTQHPETAAKDTDTRLHDEVTMGPRAEDPGEVIQKTWQRPPTTF